MRARRIAGGVTAAAAVAGMAYAAYVATTYRRYGRGAALDGAEPDTLLDRFLPAPEVAERHTVRVAAPAQVTFEAARHLDLQRSPLVRAIFRGRELLMRAHAPPAARPREFVAEVLTLGWRVLAEVPGRKVVLGAVTRPWEGDVVFRGLPADEFAAFAEPGYAKIAWTLAVDPRGPDGSVFRTETRVATTDPASRERFRRYWALLSPGILLIRRESLRLVKADAERRALGRIASAAERRRAASPAGAP
ncbi:MAG: hypothetical protein ACJ79S_17520 [Gemmatimonadaceae bacterium]